MAELRKAAEPMLGSEALKGIKLSSCPKSIVVRTMWQGKWIGGNRWGACSHMERWPPQPLSGGGTKEQEKFPFGDHPC